MTRLIRLREWQPKTISDLSAEQGLRLWQLYGKELQVEFPSPRTGGEWRVTPLGVVGLLPVTGDLVVVVEPKVPVVSLFRMIRDAFELEDLQLPPGRAQVESVDDIAAILAEVLALGMLRRCRYGLHRDYLPLRDSLPFVRGRIVTSALLRTPPADTICCDFHEHSADIPDNQIPAFALQLVLRARICRGPGQEVVRRAYHSLVNEVSVVAFRAAECRGRTYDRLNGDYRRLHALSAFFLEHLAPSTTAGDSPTIPFVIDMAKLFERFVAAWLRPRLPPAFGCLLQRSTRAGGLTFTPDLIIVDAARRPRLVLDTKYKDVALPSSADVSQVVTYAELEGCRRAVVVYPTQSAAPIDVQIGAIRVWQGAFDLSGDLDVAGKALMASLRLGEHVLATAN